MDTSLALWYGFEDVLSGKLQEMQLVLGNKQQNTPPLRYHRVSTKAFNNHFSRCEPDLYNCCFYTEFKMPRLREVAYR